SADVNGNFSHNFFSAGGGMIPVDLFNGDPAKPLALAFRGRVTDTGVRPGRPYDYDVEAVDGDGDSLTYALAAAPAGMTIDAATGRIHWDATDPELGTHPVTVRVTDGRGGAATQSYVLQVVGPGTAQVRGTKFHDLNGNGVRDGSLVEPVLVSWTIYLDDNRNGRRDLGERFTTTDAD